MNARQQQSLARLERALARLDTMPLRSVPRHLSLSIARLREAVERLRILQSEQYRSSPTNSSEGRAIQILRRRLRRVYMLELALECRDLFRHAPGVERAMKMPHASASHHVTLAAAERMIKFVSPHQRLLTEAGLDREFLREMRLTSRELRRLTTTSSARQGRHERATRELRERLAEGNRILRSIDAQLASLEERREIAPGHRKGLLRIPKRVGRPKKRKASGADEARPTGNGEADPTVQPPASDDDATPA